MFPFIFVVVCGLFESRKRICADFHWFFYTCNIHFRWRSKYQSRVGISLSSLRLSHVCMLQARTTYIPISCHMCVYVTGQDDLHSNVMSHVCMSQARTTYIPMACHMCVCQRPGGPIFQCHVTCVCHRPGRPTLQCHISLYVCSISWVFPLLMLAALMTITV
jgi:hypothetical protein